MEVEYEDSGWQGRTKQQSTNEVRISLTFMSMPSRQIKTTFFFCFHNKGTSRGQPTKDNTRMPRKIFNTRLHNGARDIYTIKAVLPIRWLARRSDFNVVSKLQGCCPDGESACRVAYIGWCQGDGGPGNG